MIRYLNFVYQIFLIAGVALSTFFTMTKVSFACDGKPQVDEKATVLITPACGKPYYYSPYEERKKREAKQNDLANELLTADSCRMLVDAKNAAISEQKLKHDFITKQTRKAEEIFDKKITPKLNAVWQSKAMKAINEVDLDRNGPQIISDRRGGYRLHLNSQKLLLAKGLYLTAMKEAAASLSEDEKKVLNVNGLNVCVPIVLEKGTATEEVCTEIGHAQEISVEDRYDHEQGITVLKKIGTGYALNSFYYSLFSSIQKTRKLKGLEDLGLVAQSTEYSDELIPNECWQAIHDEEKREKIEQDRKLAAEKDLQDYLGEPSKDSKKAVQVK